MSQLKRNGLTSDWLVNHYPKLFESKDNFDIHNSVISPDDSTLFTTSWDAK